MNAQLLEKMMPVTEEEQRILDGNAVVERALYTPREDFLIPQRQMMNPGELISVRKHTRFIDFPSHAHEFVEIMYVAQGEVTHVIGDAEVLVRTGELLMVNQYTRHAIKKSGMKDIGINIMVMPQFFDVALTMLDEDNILVDFLTGVIRRRSRENEYLHFRVGGILQIQNILENLVYSLVFRQEDEQTINQTLLGVLLWYLMKHINSLRKDSPTSYEDVVAQSTLQYIHHNYQTATLSELAEMMHQSLSTMSRLIKSSTGETFKTLLQQKRLEMALRLLESTNLPIADVVTAVGYENNSYFYRRFREEYAMSPAEYRQQNSKRGRKSP